MEIKIDSRILSKDGFLLFSQRYMNLFFIDIMPELENYYTISLKPRMANLSEYTDDFLKNELLDCEFLSCRYKETAELRNAVRSTIFTVCEEKQ